MTKGGKEEKERVDARKERDKRRTNNYLYAQQSGVTDLHFIRLVIN